MVSIGFYHPYPGGGGGGERVLWKIIKEIEQMRAEGLLEVDKVDIYCTDDHDEGEKEEFGWGWDKVT